MTSLYNLGRSPAVGGRRSGGAGCLKKIVPQPGTHWVKRIIPRCASILNRVCYDEGVTQKRVHR